MVVNVDLLGMKALGMENNTLILSLMGADNIKLKIPENARFWLATPTTVQRISPMIAGKMCLGLIVEQYNEKSHMILGGPMATYKIIIEFVPHKQIPQVNLVGNQESISSRAGDMTYAPSKQWEDEITQASKLIEEEGKKRIR